MPIDLRSDTGILIATFSGAAADNIMTAAEGNGRWRTYRSNEMPKTTEAYVIDRPFEFGKLNIHGRMAICIWEDYILIRV